MLPKKRNLVLLGVIISSLILSSCAPQTVSAQAEEPESKTTSYELNIVVEPMILNTARFTKYVRLAVTFGGQTSFYAPNHTPLTNGNPEYARWVTIAEDTLIDLAGGLDPNFLLSPAGKDYLRQNLMTQFQARVPAYQVENVYLTELVLQ